MSEPGDDEESDWAGPRSAPAPAQLPEGMPPGRKGRRGCLLWATIAVLLLAAALFVLSGCAAQDEAVVWPDPGADGEGGSSGGDGSASREGDWGGPRQIERVSPDI